MKKCKVSILTSSNTIKSLKLQGTKSQDVFYQYRFGLYDVKFRTRQKNQRQPYADMAGQYKQTYHLKLYKDTNFYLFNFFIQKNQNQNKMTKQKKKKRVGPNGTCTVDCTLDKI